MDMHERIATALGWSVKDAQSFSLSTLESLLRSVDPTLAEAIAQHRQTDSHWVTVPKIRRRRFSR